jgi:phosphotransferase system IIA component
LICIDSNHSLSDSFGGVVVDIVCNQLLSNPAHGGVYSIQHYVINVSSNKIKRHEILFKMGLNTVSLNPETYGLTCNRREVSKV